MRAAGRPAESTVASVIAFGSCSCSFHGLGEPVLELPVRVGRDIRFVERLPHVLGAEVGDFHSGKEARGRGSVGKGDGGSRFYPVQ